MSGRWAVIRPQTSQLYANYKIGINYIRPVSALLVYSYTVCRVLEIQQSSIENGEKTFQAKLLMMMAACRKLSACALLYGTSRCGMFAVCSTQRMSYKKECKETLFKLESNQHKIVDVQLFFPTDSHP